jgi:hypothetical protein
VTKNQGSLEMPTNLLKSILDATTDEVSELAIKYGQLSSLPQLTDAQSDQLEEILDRACDDGALSFWISELDHVLGHETGLLNPDCRREYNNEKSLLQEHFVEFIQEYTEDKSPEEIREFLKDYVNGDARPAILKQRPHTHAYAYQNYEEPTPGTARAHDKSMTFSTEAPS